MDNTINSTPSVPWVDGKKYLWPLPLIIVVIAACILPFYSQYPEIIGPFCWIGVFLMYVVVPILDIFLGQDKTNPPEEIIPWLDAQKYYKYIVYLFVPIQYIVTFESAYIVTIITQETYRYWDFIGISLTIGVANGIGIIVGHELGHKREKLDQWLAKFGLALVADGHFFVEHNWGHHKAVATPEDSASARMGENYWSFLIRSHFGALKSSLRIEEARLKRLGKKKWSIENHVVQTSILSILIVIVFAVIFQSWWVILMLLIQALFAIHMLEIANYIEHYGLSRRKKENGRYEMCTEEHSWNSNSILTNILFYQLQRHSDHHANPARPYQSLRNFENSPQLKYGYATYVIPMYISPWIHKIMDPRVAEHYNYDLTKAAILPSKREKYLASKYNKNGANKSSTV